MGNYVFHMSEHVEFIFLEVETINKFLIKMGTKKKELIFEEEKKKNFVKGGKELRIHFRRGRKKNQFVKKALGISCEVNSGLWIQEGKFFK